MAAWPSGSLAEAGKRGEMARTPATVTRSDAEIMLQ